MASESLVSDRALAASAVIAKRGVAGDASHQLPIFVAHGAGGAKMVGVQVKQAVVRRVRVAGYAHGYCLPGNGVGDGWLVWGLS